MPSRAGRLTVLGLALLGVLALPAQGANETRRVEGLEFDQVFLLGDSEVEIRQGEEYSLQLRGPADDLDPEPFYLKGKTLVLGARRQTFASESVDSGGELRFRIVMPELKSLRVQGSGKAYLKPFEFSSDLPRKAPDVVISVDGSGEANLFSVRGGNLDLRVEGSGDIKAARVEVDDLRAVVAGSGGLFIGSLQAQTGELVITGSGDIAVTEKSFVQSLEVSVVGSGDAGLTLLGSERTEVNIVGSGDIEIGEVLEKLNASVLGSGDIRYRGEPEVEKVELGSGEVRRRD
jgi:hypothetical protein